MAQPVTTALLEPEDNNPPMPACPTLCDGECGTWTDGAGGAHHTTGFTTITIAGGYRGGSLDVDVSASRTDEDYTAGRADVNLLPARGGEGFAMSATEARQLAAALLNAADDADPLPAGVMYTSPELLHVGDELRTDEGWQRVTGLLIFADAGQVSVFTAQRNDEDSDGWQLDPLQLVQIRRRVYGSCAVQFGEPVR